MWLILSLWNRRSAGRRLLLCASVGALLIPACQAVEPYAEEQQAVQERRPIVDGDEWKEWDVLDARTGAPGCCE